MYKFLKKLFSEKDEQWIDVRGGIGNEVVIKIKRYK